MVLVVAKKSRTFSSLPCSANERVCRNGGSTARQPAQAGRWTYSIPQTSCSAYERGLARGRNTFFLNSFFHECKSSLVQEFELFQEFGLFLSVSWVMWNLWVWQNRWAPGNRDRCPGTGSKSVVRRCENYVVYSLFCTFIIIIIISSSSISFVVLLGCLCLNPEVSPFIHFFSPSLCGEKGGVSERLSSAWLPAAELNHDSHEISIISERFM